MFGVNSSSLKWLAVCIQKREAESYLPVETAISVEEFEMEGSGCLTINFYGRGSHGGI